MLWKFSFKRCSITSYRAILQMTNYLSRLEVEKSMFKTVGVESWLERFKSHKGGFFSTANVAMSFQHLGHIQSRQPSTSNNSDYGFQKQYGFGGIDCSSAFMTVFGCHDAVKSVKYQIYFFSYAAKRNFEPSFNSMPFFCAPEPIKVQRAIACDAVQSVPPNMMA